MWHGNWHGIGRELDVGELGGRERERERDLERRELWHLSTRETEELSQCTPYTEDGHGRRR